jgi:hypothetical protein
VKFSVHVPPTAPSDCSEAPGDAESVKIVLAKW